MEESTVFDFESYLKNIFKPQLLSTYNLIDINIKYKDTNFIIQLYPYNTISDLKMAIYAKFESDKNCIPNKQLLYSNLKILSKIQTFDFTWDTSLLDDPIKIVSGLIPVSNKFVSSDGSRKIVNITEYDRILLETKNIPSQLNPNIKIFLKLMFMLNEIKNIPNII